MESRVIENTTLNRFELLIKDGLFAAAYYRIEDGRVVLVHTEVPAEFSGQGIASQLATQVFELLRKTGRKAILKCSFMAGFFARHSEYSDVVEG